MARTSSRTDPALGAGIRRRRRQLEMTLQALCDKAGLSPGYLSQVERGLATPSLGTLAQIARALDMSLDQFVGGARPADAITRQGARPQFGIEGSDMRYESLAASFPGAELSAYLLHVPPGFRSEVVAHEGEEMIFVLDGAITQMLDGEVFVLNAGDSLHYSGAAPHSWANETGAAARLLWTGTLAVLQRRTETRLPEMVPVGIVSEPNQRR